MVTQRQRYAGSPPRERGKMHVMIRHAVSTIVHGFSIAQLSKMIFLEANRARFTILVEAFP
jgi:hypothetical protein